ncbi:hypothetical protein QYE76_048560 [Lolium multiflorum]|uniref:Uncharacterized protein n=1 Tax=Lolium multiflorum TaxID=4521 RepID=A0AAD8WG04_LOLMU|nr:hypothetical protein QYE76_048560 [Lolium multiflorum]
MPPAYIKGPRLLLPHPLLHRNPSRHKAPAFRRLGVPATQPGPRGRPWRVPVAGEAVEAAALDGRGRGRAAVVEQLRPRSPSLRPLRLPPTWRDAAEFLLRIDDDPLGIKRLRTISPSLSTASSRRICSYGRPATSRWTVEVCSTAGKMYLHTGWGKFAVTWRSSRLPAHLPLRGRR